MFIVTSRSELKKFNDRLNELYIKLKHKAKCSNCDKPNSNLKCSKCKLVFYCSKECQVKDWSTHKLLCKDQL